MKETARERQWYPSDQRYLHQESVPENTFVKVPHEGSYYQLIWRLRKADDKGLEPEPDELRPEALSKMEEISLLWAQKMKEYGLNPDTIRLAITSLYRTEKLQTSLTTGEGAYFAAPPRESSHLAGAAFDIDPNGYFVLTGENTYVNVHKAGQVFNPQVIQILREVLVEQAKNESINFVVENKIVPSDKVLTHKPTVFHVCTNSNNTQAHS
ncbi:MAG: DUF5715 family protein [Patescibacteria group bacterium]